MRREQLQIQSVKTAREMEPSFNAEPYFSLRQQLQFCLFSHFTSVFVSLVLSALVTPTVPLDFEILFGFSHRDAWAGDSGGKWRKVTPFYVRLKTFDDRTLAKHSFFDCKFLVFPDSPAVSRLKTSVMVMWRVPHGVFWNVRFWSPDESKVRSVLLEETNGRNSLNFLT